MAITTRNILEARKINIHMVRALAQRIYNHSKEIAELLDLSDEQLTQLILFTSWLCDHGLESVIEREDKFLKLS